MRKAGGVILLGFCFALIVSMVVSAGGDQTFKEALIRTLGGVYFLMSLIALFCIGFDQLDGD